MLENSGRSVRRRSTEESARKLQTQPPRSTNQKQICCRVAPHCTLWRFIINRVGSPSTAKGCSHLNLLLGLAAYGICSGGCIANVVNESSRRRITSYSSRKGPNQPTRPEICRWSTTRYYNDLIRFSNTACPIRVHTELSDLECIVHQACTYHKVFDMIFERYHYLVTGCGNVPTDGGQIDWNEKTKQPLQYSGQQRKPIAWRSTHRTCGCPSVSWNPSL